MIICYKEAAIPSFLYHVVDTCRRIVAFIVRKCTVKPGLILMIQSTASYVSVSVPANLNVFGLEGDKADMTGLARLAEVRLCNVYFIRHEGEEAIVRKVRMVEHYVVVGISEYRITVAFVHFLKLFRGTFAVGSGRVAMKICLVKISGFGK